MIYTVTFNPSLDYIVSVEDFKWGMTNRTSSEMILPGGKGINVSIVLKNLGIESTVLGFTGGFTGKEIERRIKELGIPSGFIQLQEGTSRINVKLKSTEGTEINGNGPYISQEEIGELLKQLEKLKASDMLVLAGSVPSCLSDEIYGEIISKMEEKKVQTVVDATGQLLLKVLPYRPFLVKPNSHELGEIFQVELKEREQVIPYARKLQELGACNVLVSMAGEGAVLAAADGQVYEAPAPKGILVNSVGAGDSMVAGFLAGFQMTYDYINAFCMGLAAGSASAFSPYLAEREEVKKLFEEMKEILEKQKSC